MTKPSLTIGVPAYNEEKNILSLIESIMGQMQNNYVLKQIIIAVDGSTDETSEIITKISSKNSKVLQLKSLTRKGKIFQLNKMYNLTNSDIFLTLDADITLKNKNTLDTILSYFSDPNISAVGANTLPLPPENFFEKIVITWLYIWEDIRSHYKNGHTIHNHLGCALALKKNLYKTLTIPSTILSDEDYIYVFATERGFKFQFARNATVYYRTVQNIKDYYKQHGRFLSLKKSVQAYFGNRVLSYYSIPRKYKIDALKRSFYKTPLLTIFALCLQFFLILFLKIKPISVSGKLWNIAQSSKSI